MKKVVILLAVIIVVLLGIVLFYNPVQGPTVTNNLDFLVSAPQANALVTSPLGIQGEANGSWFFEAVFPIKIVDGDGTVLGQVPANAIGPWQTTGTVPFSATLTFAAPKYATGTIVFANDNPSGLPANAKQFTLPVRFK